MAHHREELGDLLLQVVFQSAMAQSWGWFGLDDVVAGIGDKLERRHPHVFGDTTVAGVDEVLANWEKIKLAEKKDRGALDGIPRALPALLKTASTAHPGAKTREEMSSAPWGRGTATPPWGPPRGPARAGMATKVAVGKSPARCSRAAACQCVSCRRTT